MFVIIISQSDYQPNARNSVQNQGTTMVDKFLINEIKYVTDRIKFPKHNQYKNTTHITSFRDDGPS